MGAFPPEPQDGAAVSLVSHLPLRPERAGQDDVRNQVAQEPSRLFLAVVSGHPWPMLLLAGVGGMFLLYPTPLLVVTSPDSSSSPRWAETGLEKQARPAPLFS